MKNAYLPLIVFAITFSLFLFGSYSFAADSVTVTATVTVQNISVSIDNSTIDYGVISLSGTKDTTAAANQLNTSITATNNGNVSEDINIRGENISGSWTLSATAGNEQYTHKYCITTCDTTPTWVALTVSNQVLADGLAASGTQVFDLQIGAPSATTHFDQQSAVVTVQASAN